MPGQRSRRGLPPTGVAMVVVMVVVTEWVNPKVTRLPSASVQGCGMARVSALAW
jgi:hypothetical protein